MDMERETDGKWKEGTDGGRARKGKIRKRV